VGKKNKLMSEKTLVQKNPGRQVFLADPHQAHCNFSHKPCTSPKNYKELAFANA
jgi:hypothetical protein